MFSSKNDSASASVTNEAQAANSKRTVRSESVPSIISSNVVVKGTLTSTGEIQIDGRVDGDVRCVSLVISDSGEIYGEILAGDVTIRGHVKGHIRARKVLLGVGSRVEGDILHESFVVEVGAFFEGNCRHSDNPLAEAPKKVAEIKPALIPAMPAEAVWATTKLVPLVADS